MANYRKGILGAFSGKVGNVIGASWRNLDVIRSLPRKSKKEPTMSQLEQRQKFGLIIKFLSIAHQIIKMYFGKDRGNASKMNVAVAYHLHNAITGIFNQYSIDYSKVLFTKGDLFGFNQISATMIANQTCELSYDGQSGQSNAQDQDQLLIVVYNEDLNYIKSYEHVSTRVAGNGSVMLPPEWASHQVHIWASLVSENGRAVSTSQYLGSYVVL